MLETVANHLTCCWNTHGPSYSLSKPTTTNSYLYQEEFLSFNYDKFILNNGEVFISHFIKKEIKNKLLN